MLKLLLMGLAVALLLWLLFGRGGRRAPRFRGGSRSASPAESMVTCAHCGVHLPRSEALAARGLHYCSASHRDTAPPAA
jgi:uncharacterized protein